MDKHKARIPLNISMICIHLGLQLVIGYWSVVIDGYTCQQQYVKNVSYIGYTLIVLNLLAYAFFKSRDIHQILKFILFFIDLGLIALVMFYAIDGFNNYNNCASTRVLYQFYLIQSIASAILLFFTMIGNIPWSDRYVHWVSNIAWPILFLSSLFPTPLLVSAIVIGAIFSILTVVGFVLNCYTYNNYELKTGIDFIFKMVWAIGIVLCIGLQILAIVMLCIYGKGGDYNWQFGRKIFVIFAGVNIIDILFYFYGRRRVQFWSFNE